MRNHDIVDSLMIVVEAGANSAFNSAGTDWHGPSYPMAAREHFSGNFWWATGEYFLGLPDNIGPEYTAPEQYILMNDSARQAQIWNSGLAGGYLQLNVYPLSAYLHVKDLNVIPH